MGCGPWWEAVLVDPLGSWLSNGPGMGGEYPQRSSREFTRSALSFLSKVLAHHLQEALRTQPPRLFSPSEKQASQSPCCRGTLSRAGSGVGKGPSPCSWFMLVWPEQELGYGGSCSGRWSRTSCPWGLWLAGSQSPGQGLLVVQLPGCAWPIPTTPLGASSPWGLHPPRSPW